MNSFALAADSHSWWLPSAIAGAIGAVTLGAILILPTLGQAGPVDNPAGDSPDRGTCFAERPARHGVDQLPQPVCR